MGGCLTPCARRPQRSHVTSAVKNQIPVLLVRQERLLIWAKAFVTVQGVGACVPYPTKSPSIGVQRREHLPLLSDVAYIRWRGDRLARRSNRGAGGGDCRAER